MPEFDRDDVQAVQPALTLDDLPVGLLERVVDRLRAVEPAAIGVLVTGSYAARRATHQSDLDVTVLTAMPSLAHYRTWFEPRPGAPLHVSAGGRALDAWVDEGKTAADWALGFPTEEVATWVWATDAARAVLGDPPVMRRPSADPDLEDFLECATKAKRAAGAGDALGARWHAHHLGAYAIRLLRPLNPERRVIDVRDALRVAVDLPVAPVGYRDNLLPCLGLRQASDGEVADAAVRLATTILAFLRERMPDVDRQPDLPQYLADGTLERHLAAMPPCEEPQQHGWRDTGRASRGARGADGERS